MNVESIFKIISVSGIPCLSQIVSPIRDINEPCGLPTHELHVLVLYLYLDGGHVGGHRDAVNSSKK